MMTFTEAMGMDMEPHLLVEHVLSGEVEPETASDAIGLAIIMVEDDLIMNMVTYQAQNVYQTKKDIMLGMHVAAIYLEELEEASIIDWATTTVSDVLYAHIQQVSAVNSFLRLRDQHSTYEVSIREGHKTIGMRHALEAVQKFEKRQGGVSV